MPTNDGANGTTISVAGSAQATVISCSYSENGNEVDVTTMASSQHEYVAGIKDLEFTCEVVGAVSVSVGDLGATTISWNDGGSDTHTNTLVTSVEHSGGLDGQITTSITIKPAPA